MINPKHVKYCVECGHWLLDDTFKAEPVKINVFKKGFGLNIKTITAFLFLIIFYSLISSPNIKHTLGNLAPLFGFGGLLGILISIVTIILKALSRKGSYRNAVILGIFSIISFMIGIMITPSPK